MKKHFLALLLSLSLLPMLFSTFVNAQGSTPAVQTYIGTLGTTSITTEIGSTVTLSASSATGIQWYESNSSDLNDEHTMITKIDGATSSTCTVPTGATGTYYYFCTYSNGDYKSNVLTVTVNNPSYTISASSSSLSDGTVTGDGSYTMGSSCTLTATPVTGYNFVNWTENGTSVSTSLSYTFTVSSNRNLTANFYKIVSLGDDFIIDNIKYSITSLIPAQVKVIKNTDQTPPCLTIPSKVTIYGVDYTVNSIADRAFENAAIKSINLPESVTSIGINAFTYCANLTSVTIPASVTTIEDYAFHLCSKLGVVTIANSSTIIADNAFSNTKTKMVFLSDSETRPSSWNFWSSTYQYYKIGTFLGVVSNIGRISAATVVSPNGGLGGAKTTVVPVSPATVNSMRTTAGIPASYATIAAGDLKIGNGEFNGPLTITFQLSGNLDQYDMAHARVLHKHVGSLEVLTPVRIDKDAMSNFLSCSTQVGASPFVIVAPLKNSQASQPANAAENPKTGDTSFLFIWGMLSMALCGAIVIIKRIRA